MPTLRTTRRRSRKPKNFTPAQLQYLTGEPQTGANKFELMHLEHASRPAEIEALNDLLDRAAGIVPAERIEQLRQQIAST